MGTLPLPGVSHLVGELNVCRGHLVGSAIGNKRGSSPSESPAWDLASSLENSLSFGQEKEKLLNIRMGHQRVSWEGRSRQAWVPAQAVPLTNQVTVPDTSPL